MSTVSQPNHRPFQLPAPRAKKRPTRLDIVEGDLYLFQEKTDQEVLDCEFVWDCIEQGYLHGCNCRPEWYLKQMKEKHNE